MVPCPGPFRRRLETWSIWVRNNLDDTRREIDCRITFCSHIILALSTETISLRLNFFSGAIPDVFAAMPRLNFFDLSDNELSGNIPSTIFLSPDLEIVYLANNTLSGPIPPSYSTPPNLKDLYLDGNQLTGTIPGLAQPGQLTHLQEFLLQLNNLGGSMPASVCQLTEFGQGGRLIRLFADCGGADPKVGCDFPTCCDRCFPES